MELNIMKWKQMKEYIPDFKKGCRSNIEIIAKHDLTDRDWKYARLDETKNEWILTKRFSTKYDKRFITKSWYVKHYDDTNIDTSESEEDDASETASDSESKNEENSVDIDSNEDDVNETESDESADEDVSQDDSSKDEETETEITCTKLPPIITLSENEKFSVSENKKIEIEVRGIREQTGCYFKVSDVSKGFRIFKLQNSILNKKSSYDIDVHYKLFCDDTNAPPMPINYDDKKKHTSPMTVIYGDKKKTSAPMYGNSVHKKNHRQKRIMFLTYEGMMKVLYTSRTDQTKKFTSWATKTVFTAHIGTADQKLVLASDLVGVGRSTLLSVLKVASTAWSGIYLFYIGTAGELRKKYNIDKSIASDTLIGKYGRTGNLEERTKKHVTKYGAQIELLIFEIVDPEFVVNAETSISHYFNAHNCKLFEGTPIELVTFSKKKINLFKEQYSLVAGKHNDKYQQQIANIKILAEKHERELEVIRHSIELDKLRHTSELDKLRYEKELSHKDNEIMKAKYELLLLKNKK
jgi:hypothetical protein